MSITYGYCCEDCGFEFEIEQSIKADALTLCPYCEKHKLIRTINVPLCFVKGEPGTLQHLADRNASRMGSYELQERTALARKRVKGASQELLDKVGTKNFEHSNGQLPWWRSGEVEGFPRSEKPLDAKGVEKATAELAKEGIIIKDKSPAKQPSWRKDDVSNRK